MPDAHCALSQQGAPSDVVVPGLLDGIGNVLRLVHKQFAHPHRGPAPLQAPEAEVRRVIEAADRLSPLLANLSPAIERIHRLHLTRVEEA